MYMDVLFVSYRCFDIFCYTLLTLYIFVAADDKLLVDILATWQSIGYSFRWKITGILVKHCSVFATITYSKQYNTLTNNNIYKSYPYLSAFCISYFFISNAYISSSNEFSRLFGLIDDEFIIIFCEIDGTYCRVLNCFELKSFILILAAWLREIL